MHRSTHTRARRALPVLLALAVAGPLQAGQAGAPPPAPEAAAAPVAQALGTPLMEDELEALLLTRRARGEEGRAALRHMAESRLLALLGGELGLIPPPSEIERRLAELDQQIRSAGDAQGLAGHLRKARLTREQFARFLGLAAVQETLTRRALRLKADEPVTGDQQRLWMDEALAERRYQELEAPWQTGVVARAGGFEIARAEFLDFLRERLPPEALREDCYQLLLVRRMRARMPDLAPERLERYVQDELERRRREAAADPRTKGVPWEQLLAAQGVLPGSLARDPAVLAAALARAWVERSYRPEELKLVYQSERDLFDGHFGPAVETWSLFLRGAGFKNELNPRSFAEAEQELERLKGGLRTLDDFKRLAHERSEDAQTKEAHGALGWLTPLSPKVPADLRATIAAAVGPAEARPAGPLAGPLRLPNGCVLLWLGARRPPPAWEEMSGHVQRELRRRFVEEVLPRAALVTVFDGS